MEALAWCLPWSCRVVPAHEEIVRCHDRMRRTRILSTIGPATESPDRIRALIDAGTDVIRLNFSHGTIDWHQEMYRRIRRAAAEAGRFIAVLQDLSGPKIRIGRVTTPITLEPGGTLAIE